MPARIAHFEIQGPDDTGVAAFYRELLDWPIQSRGEGYSIVDREAAGIGGAITDADERRVVLGVTVADLDAAVARVAALGGAVLMEPTDNGWVTKALVTDPAGNQLSLIAGGPSSGG